MRAHARTISLVAIPVALVMLVVACGARGPLDDDGPLVSIPTEASASDGPSAPDATGPDDGGSDAMSGRDAGADAGSDGGSVIECGSCVLTSCGAGILMCLEDTACRDTLQCVTTTCLSSGSPDLGCLIGCASGDIAGALQIVQVFQCVTGTCGADCGSVLGGLLGGLGGGGP